MNAHLVSYPKEKGERDSMSRKIRPTFTICMAFQDVFDAKPDLGDARGALRQFDLSAVLQVLGKVNALLMTWRGTPDLDIDLKIASEFFPNAEARRREVARLYPNPVFFTRLGVLGAMRLALEECPIKGGSLILEPRDVAVVLGCSVMINDLSSPTTLTPNPAAADIIGAAIHLHDSSGRPTFESDIARSLMLFEEEPVKPSEGERGLDMRTLFKQCVGIDPRRFAEICLSIGARYVNLTEAILGTNPEQFFIPPDYFSQTTLSPDELAFFLNNVAVTHEEMAKKIAGSPQRPLSDLTPFQQHPLIRLPDGRFYCLDLGYLLEKPGRGMYWTLRSAAPESLWDQLPGEYGDLFDAYLSSLIPEHMLDRSYVPHPGADHNDELFDGVLVEGSDLVVLEFKSSVLRADRKYGGDNQQLLAEIDKKFVTGDGTGPKGLAQIQRGIDALFAGNPIPGVNRERIQKIYPMMIVLERSMTVPGMSRYLNSRFDRRVLGKRHRVTITPLTIIDVENFERLIPYIELYGMGPLLDSYYGAHVRSARDQLVPLKPRNIPFLDSQPRLPERSRERFLDFLRSLGLRMFGEQAAFSEVE